MHNWQTQLREGFRDVGSLLTFLDLPESSLSVHKDTTFPVRVPYSFANRMGKGNPLDPLLLQVLPLQKETELQEGFSKDAVGDLHALKQKGMIQKYQGRVLLLMTGACAVHCRYCFRRHFPYSDNSLSIEAKQDLLQSIASDSSIEEVIFSGGDPLVLNNNALGAWAQELAAIPHIKRWRLHTRLPSVLPARIDQGLLEVLQGFQNHHRQTVLVTHINHPNEINHEVHEALRLLRDGGVTLLNQAVLLRQINDEVATLKALSEQLFGSGVLPYYLHLLDRTQGTHHFEVPEETAHELYQRLSSVLPGYLLPKLVREVEGQPHKVIFGHSTV